MVKWGNCSSKRENTVIRKHDIISNRQQTGGGTYNRQHFPVKIYQFYEPKSFKSITLWWYFADTIRPISFARYCEWLVIFISFIGRRRWNTKLYRKQVSALTHPEKAGLSDSISYQSLRPPHTKHTITDVTVQDFWVLRLLLFKVLKIHGGGEQLWPPF